MYRIYIDNELAMEVDGTELIKFVSQHKTSVMTDIIVRDVNQYGRRSFGNITIRRMVDL